MTLAEPYAHASPGAETGDDRYRSLLESIDLGFCVIEMKFDANNRPLDYRFLELNAAFEDQTGLTDVVGRWMRDIAPNHEQHWFDIYGQVAMTGKAARYENHAEALGRWYEVHARRIDDPSLRRVAIFFQDVTERHRAEIALRESESRLRLLINELNHRVKNTLATVQSLAHHTVRGKIGLDEARRRLTERLLALSGAHNVLTRENWEGAGLRQVLGETLRPYAADGKSERTRIEIDCDDVRLGPSAALAISMAIHELATNATKYGALSSEKGEVLIKCRAVKDQVEIVWRERGGPAVTKPNGSGFGLRLLQRRLAADLGGPTQVEFHPSGLVCTLRAQRQAALTSPADSPT